MFFCRNLLSNELSLFCAPTELRFGIYRCGAIGCTRERELLPCNHDISPRKYISSSSTLLRAAYCLYDVSPTASRCQKCHDAVVVVVGYPTQMELLLEHPRSCDLTCSCAIRGMFSFRKVRLIVPSYTALSDFFLLLRFQIMVARACPCRRVQVRAILTLTFDPLGNLAP